jgi:hypothetical protein
MIFTIWGSYITYFPHTLFFDKALICELHLRRLALFSVHVSAVYVYSLQLLHMYLSLYLGLAFIEIRFLDQIRCLVKACLRYIIHTLYSRLYWLHLQTHVAHVHNPYISNNCSSPLDGCTFCILNTLFSYKCYSFFLLITYALFF